MKQAINFRLDEVVLKTIAGLAKDLHTSKTAIVEQSVLQFAAKVNHKKNILLQFAGTLSENDAAELLNTIQQDKSSKDVEFNL
jgi:predicted transcriptional regulator